MQVEGEFFSLDSALQELVRSHFHVHNGIPIRKLARRLLAILLEEYPLNKVGFPHIVQIIDSWVSSNTPLKKDLNKDISLKIVNLLILEIIKEVKKNPDYDFTFYFSTPQGGGSEKTESHRSALLHLEILQVQIKIALGFSASAGLHIRPIDSALRQPVLSQLLSGKAKAHARGKSRKNGGIFLCSVNTAETDRNVAESLRQIYKKDPHAHRLWTLNQPIYFAGSIDINEANISAVKWYLEALGYAKLAARLHTNQIVIIATVKPPLTLVGRYAPEADTSPRALLRPASPAASAEHPQTGPTPPAAGASSEQGDPRKRRPTQSL